MTSDLAVTGYFNPLPRKEGDRQEHANAVIKYGISIHSLVKRETEN